MKGKENKNLLTVISSGTQMVALLIVPVVVCLLLGIWLDKQFHVAPWFLIVGVLLGFTTSIWNVYKMIK